jgi:transposase-like protein
LGERNGVPDRGWDTRVGSIELRVPRGARRRLLLALLEPRRGGERALVAVIQKAYVRGARWLTVYCERVVAGS